MTILTPTVLVIGAGPAGSAVAWKLASQGVDVLLIDAASFPRDKTCGDGLPPMAIATLRSMGVLEKVEAVAQRIDLLAIRSPNGAVIEASFEQMMGSGYYALVCPREILDDILRRHAVESGARFLGEAKVTHINRDPSGRILEVDVKQPVGSVRIQPELVVVAVGANMGLLKRIGILSDVPQVMRAARAYFQLTADFPPRYSFYFDRELAPGYGWIFPTGSDTANIGIGIIPTPWATEEPSNRVLESFILRLEERDIARVKRQLSPLKGYPIRTDFPPRQITGPNWALVGESIGLVNPLTGEGIDLALESGLMAGHHAARIVLRTATTFMDYEVQVKERWDKAFHGLKAVQTVFANPLTINYMVRRMQRDKIIRERVINVAQGFEPPRKVFVPGFWLRLLNPVS